MNPQLLMILGGLGIVGGIVVLIWRIQSSARKDAQQAQFQRDRADDAEAAYRGAIETRAAERRIEDAAAKARNNAKDDPTAWN